MKNLRKTGIIFALLFVAFATQAQVKLGVKGGLNVSTLSGMDKLANVGEGLLDEAGESLLDGQLSVGSRVGFHLGVMAQFDLPANFFLQPELLFSVLGDKEKMGTRSETNSLNYLQLPVYVGYKIGAGGGLNVILGVGPYFGCGISGTDDIFKKNDEGYFKRLDVGAAAMGGIQFNKLQITVGYDFGLVDMMDVNGWKTVKDMLGLSSISNRNLKVSVGYFF
jgi:hypothetical protein